MGDKMEDKVSPTEIAEYLFSKINDLDELPSALLVSEIFGISTNPVQPRGSSQINVDAHWFEILGTVRSYVATIAAVVSAYVGLRKISEKKLTEEELIEIIRADDSVKSASQKLTENELKDIVRFVRSKAQ